MTFSATVTVEGGHESDLSDAVTLDGTTQQIVDADDNKVFVWDVTDSLYRYLRLKVDGNAILFESSCLCYQYFGDRGPVTQPSDVAAVGFHAPPAV